MTDIITSREFDTVVKSGGLPVLVDLYSDNCGPCILQAPIVESLSQDLAGKAKIVKLNRATIMAEAITATLNAVLSKAPTPAEVDEMSKAEAVLKFLDDNKIRSLPSLMLFDKGEYKGALQGGPRTKANIRKWMEDTLGYSFDAAAPVTAAEAEIPELADYGVVLKDVPRSYEAAREVMDQMRVLTQPALKPFYEKGEAHDAERLIRIGGTDENPRIAFLFHGSFRAAQAVAGALADYEVVDFRGENPTPVPKQAPAVARSPAKAPGP